MPERTEHKNRPYSGTNVYIVGGIDGSKVIGQVRLVDSRGVDITNPSKKSINASLTGGDEIIGKVMLVDGEGNDIGALLRIVLQESINASRR